MKTLLILRHAKSSWGNAQLADYDRPLNERGRADAPRVGRWLRQQELIPDLIITSAAERALATAESVALTSGYEAEIRVTRRLYEADVDDYLAVIGEMGGRAEVLLVVGHNPTVEDLVMTLCGQTEQMSTAALAQMRLDIAQWANLSAEVKGQLVSIWRPREGRSG